MIYLLIGLILGPSFLKLIPSTDFVQTLGHLGAIVMLFIIGLEFKIKDIFNLRYTTIALFGVIVPWIGGFLTAHAFGFDFANSVFTGTALTATSIAITASVLKDMGKLQTGTAKAIIGAAVIDDILGLLALSLSGQIVGATFSFTTMFTSLSIVGAFLSGIFLRNILGSQTKIIHYFYVISSSIFFISLGILVDIHIITPAVFWFMSVLTIVAILTKVVGCFLPAKWQGLSFKDAAIVGFGMSPRGEVAMIVGLIGLNQNLITHEIYAAIIFMSLITTIVTPIVLRNWLYK